MSDYPKTCRITDCAGATVAKNLCSKHYQRWKTSGDPLKTRYVSPNTTADDRLRHHGWVVSTTGCWEWAGYRNNHGYGALRMGRGGLKMAHRVAYETWVGPIPSELPGMDFRGVVIRHTCDNRSCINPEHLTPGTNSDSMGDMVKRGSLKGQKNPKAKLNREQVENIRSSETAPKVLAKKYGVSQHTIRDIRSGKTWKE